MKKTYSPIAATENGGAEHNALSVGAGKEEKRENSSSCRQHVCDSAATNKTKGLTLTVCRHPLMLPFEGLTPP